MNPTLPPFVQDQLDRGVDPIGDPRTQAWLLDHPEALPSFAALRETLRGLSSSRSPARPATRTWRPVAWIAAAAVAAALPFAFAGEGPDQADAALPRPDFSSTGGVVFSRVATTRVTGAQKHQRVEVFASSGSNGTARPARRDLTTQSKFLRLPGPTTPWSIASITEHKSLLP